MNPRDLPEEPGLGKPLPRKEEKPSTPSKDTWKPYGEKGSGLEQNSRTGELRTNRPTPSAYGEQRLEDSMMLIKDMRVCQKTMRNQLPSYNISSSVVTTSEHGQSPRSGEIWGASPAQNLVASFATDAEKSGLASLATVEKIVAVTLLLEYGNAPTDRVRSTAMAVFQALQSGGQKTNLPGTTTGQMGQGSMNVHDCLYEHEEEIHWFRWEFFSKTGPKLAVGELKKVMFRDATIHGHRQGWHWNWCRIPEMPANEIVAYAVLWKPE